MTPSIGKEDDEENFTVTMINRLAKSERGKTGTRLDLLSFQSAS